MRSIIRLACFGYWILLTLLLVTPEPASLLGLHSVPTFPWGKFGVHLGFFTVLSVLVCAVWWSKRLWPPMVGLLVIYALTTESLQLLVPPRTARVMDAIENLLGIAAGIIIYWLLQQALQATVASRRAITVPEHATEGEAISK